MTARLFSMPRASAEIVRLCGISNAWLERRFCPWHPKEGNQQRIAHSTSASTAGCSWRSRFFSAFR